MAPQAGSTLIVRIGDRRFGLAPGLVQEVLRPQALTRVPLAPAALLGVMHYRGQVLPILCAARLLDAPAVAPGVTARIIVMQALGLMVDEVIGFGASEAEPLDIEALLAAGFASAAPLPTAMPAAPGGDVAPRAVDAGLKLAVLRLAGQDYALPVATIAEIAALPPDITAVPGMDGAMLGAVSHRGGLLPLLSLRVLLGLPLDGFDPAKARIVVVHLAGSLAGLVVDGVAEIVPVPSASITPVPPVLIRGRAEAKVAGMIRLPGRRLITLLAVDQLLDEATMTRLQAQPARPASADHAAATGPHEIFVTVRMGGETYGLPLAAVTHIVRHPGQLAHLPHAPDFVAGVMNLGGVMLPVLDQRCRFGAAQGEDANSYVVVLRIGSQPAGLVVDAATALATAPHAATQPAPALAGTQSRIFDRIAMPSGSDVPLLVISPQALLDDAQRAMLAQLAAS